MDSVNAFGVHDKHYVSLSHLSRWMTPSYHFDLTSPHLEMIKINSLFTYINCLKGHKKWIGLTIATINSAIS